jgi:hypothetical protein
MRDPVVAPDVDNGAGPAHRRGIAMPLLVSVGLVAALLIAFVAHNGNEAALAGKQRTPKLPARTYVNAVDSTGLDSGGIRLFTVTCDDGDHLLSGGFRNLDPGTEIVSSFPGGTGDNPHWTVEWRNAANNTDDVTLFAYCADFAPVH